MSELEIPYPLIQAYQLNFTGRELRGKARPGGGQALRGTHRREVAVGGTLPGSCIARRNERRQRAFRPLETILIPCAMPTDDTKENDSAGWASAWPDALAFVVWLAVAWYAKWTATDLVWSLWLSSLVVGYTLIVWTIFRPGFDIARGLWQARNDPGSPSRGWSMSVTRITRSTESPATTVKAPDRSGTMSAVAMGGFLLLGGLFVLGFFTIHFVGFHYVHSQFLMMFFPLDGDVDLRHRMSTMSAYLEVARRYWRFLPMAFIAERGAFRRNPPVGMPPDVSVTAAAIAARKAANAKKPAGAFAEPYRNVMRMHLLIFFFLFAQFVGLENFFVYTVVYTVYFFPWRLVRRQGPAAAAAAVFTGS